MCVLDRAAQRGGEGARDCDAMGGGGGAVGASGPELATLGRHWQGRSLVLEEVGIDRRGLTTKRNASLRPGKRACFAWLAGFGTCGFKVKPDQAMGITDQKRAQERSQWFKTS